MTQFENQDVSGDVIDGDWPIKFDQSRGFRVLPGNELSDLTLDEGLGR